MGFLHRTHEIIGHEAADLMHFDMLIFLRLHQMEAELLCAAALGGLEDHGSTSRFSASINMRRISRISATAARSAASVSGVTGRLPELADRANWLRLADSRDWPSLPNT